MEPFDRTTSWVLSTCKFLGILNYYFFFLDSFSTLNLLPSGKTYGFFFWIWVRTRSRRCPAGHHRIILRIFGSMWNRLFEEILSIIKKSSSNFNVKLRKQYAILLYIILFCICNFKRCFNWGNVACQQFTIQIFVIEIAVMAGYSITVIT